MPSGPAFATVAMKRENVGPPPEYLLSRLVYTPLEPPDHPAPRTWGYQPPYFAPAAGLIVTRQERPWHPSSVLFEGVQVPLPFVFAYTARVVVSQATASTLVGAGSVAVKII